MTYPGHQQIFLCGDAGQISLLRKQVPDAQLGQDLI